MGLLSFLNSGTKAAEIAEKSVDQVSKGIDALIYTEEEKALAYEKRLEWAGKMVEAHTEHMKVLNAESTVRSITRRWIAIMIFAFTFISLPCIVILFKISHTAAKFAVDLYCAFNVPEITLAAAIFFFGNHMLANFQAGKK